MKAKPNGFANANKPSRRKVKEWQETTNKLIKETGRAVIAVKGPEDESPLWAYTLGNCLTQDTAEVICFYPSEPTLRFVLNHVSDLLKADADEPLALSETEPTLIYGCLGADGEIPVRARLLTSMERVIAYEKYTCQLPSVAIPVLLIDLPDPAGNWPEDAECAPPVREIYERQPFTATVPTNG